MGTGKVFKVRNRNNVLYISYENVNLSNNKEWNKTGLSRVISEFVYCTGNDWRLNVHAVSNVTEDTL